MLKERLALLSMFLIAKTHYRGGSSWTAEGLSRYLGIPTDPIEKVLASLVARGLLVQAGDEPPVYIPDRAPETVTVKYA